MIAKIRPLYYTFVDLKPSLSRGARIVLALGYTALLTLLLVQSSARPLLGPSAPQEFNLVWEILLTLAHFLGFALLVLFVWGALAAGGAQRWALIAAVLFACTLGLSTELLQSLVPDRSASLFDLAVNWGVSLLVARHIHLRGQRAVLE
jgi:VanZ family protein